MSRANATFRNIVQTLWGYGATRFPHRISGALALGLSLIAWLLVGNVRPVLAQFAETETILPFQMQHQTIMNPARAAWKAALPSPCGPDDCPDRELDVYYHIPTHAKAVVYVFHGGSGSAQMWITGEEEAALIGDLVRHDYAVVLLESTHRPVDRNWFLPDPERFDPALLDDTWNATVNADEQLVRNVHTLLGFTTSTKVFLVGFSSGAKFAIAMAYNLKLAPPALNDYYYLSPRTNTVGGLNVRAVAVYNTDGGSYYFGNYVPGVNDPASVPVGPYTTPTIFNYSLNDHKNNPRQVAANANFLAALGVAVEHNLGVPLPLLQDRFTRVLGFSYVESRALYAALVDDPTLGYVDANGFVQDMADTAQAVHDLPASKRQGVLDQFKVLRAEHHVSSQYHDRTVALFEAHL